MIHLYDFESPVTEEVNLYAKWNPDEDTSYTVKHYIEQSGGSFNLQETEQLEGTTDTVATATPKTFTGYIYNPLVSGTVKSGTIEANGSLVLKLYYQRQQYIVSFEENGGSEVQPQDVYYGDKVTAEVTTKAGFNFDGWYTDPELTASYDFNGAVSNGFELYAKWVPKEDTPYIIQHFIEGANGTYQLSETEQKQGITNAEVSASPKTFNGYKYNPYVTGTVKTGKVAPDGSLILKLYYLQEQYTVSFEENGGKPVKDQIVKYKGTAKEVKTTKSGYSFVGWYTSSKLKSKYKFTTQVTKNITVYAKWDKVIKTYSVVDQLGNEIEVEDNTIIKINPNGGEWDETDNTSQITVQKNTYIKDPIRKGYTFKGWKLVTSNDGKTKMLTAQWKKDDTVPRTGDNFNLALCVAIVFVSGCFCIYLLATSKKKKGEA